MSINVYNCQYYLNLVPKSMVSIDLIKKKMYHRNIDKFYNFILFGGNKNEGI